MIEVKNLTKVYGKVKAVDNVSFSVPDGSITGFIGPNGAGKTTTIRCLLGLDRPTSGQCLINGVPYLTLKNPLAWVGVLLDAKAAVPSFSIEKHIKIIASSNNIPYSRVDDVMKLTGVYDVRKRKMGKLSLGMGQRVGISIAMLADPQILILDEPVNGLDPEGIKWIRELCRTKVSNGGSVFISSHLMSELEQIVDRVVIIGKGKIIRTDSLDKIISETSGSKIIVEAENKNELIELLSKNKISYCEQEGKTVINDMTKIEVAKFLQDNKILVLGISEYKLNLEDAYSNITDPHIEFKTDKN